MAERTAPATRRSSRREPVLAALLPVERLLFASELVCIGSFRCTTDHPIFPGGAPSTSSCFVFPRTSVFIQHEGSRRFLADPTLVTFYNRGEAYRRFAVSPEGDRADWFALAPDLLVEAVRARDPRVADRPARPFRFERAPSDAAVYLAQRTLLESLARGERADPFAIEESVFQLLDHVLERAYSAAGSPQPRPPADRDCVELARGFLAQRFGEPLSLASVAAAAGVSVPHLCRSFRRRTGRTLTAHRQELRLRASLERVAAGDDLSAVALDLGFSSHSHFTASFRRAFGQTPSAARGVARAPLAWLRRSTTSALGVLFALAGLGILTACGGGDSPPLTPGGTETATFMGTTSSNAPGSCMGQTHRITAGQGTLAVTLVQTTPSVALMVQLCPSGANVDHSRDCTINRTRMEVGQTLSGSLRGGSAQELVFNPLSCGGGEPPPPTPINYTASVLYPR